MNTTEIAFFGLALFLPLVGGSVLLYLLSKEAKKKQDDEGPKGQS